MLRICDCSGRQACLKLLAALQGQGQKGGLAGSVDWDERCAGAEMCLGVVGGVYVYAASREVGCDGSEGDGFGREQRVFDSRIRPPRNLHFG